MSPGTSDPDQRHRGIRTSGERERMTITDTRTEEPDSAAPHGPGAPSASAAVTAPPARVAGWLVSADHTRIGRLYIGASLLAAVAVLVVGTLVMAERIDTGGTFLPTDTIDQLTTFLWMGLAFLVVVPLLLGVAIAVVPLQIGAPGHRLPAGGRAVVLGLVPVGRRRWSRAYLANGGPGGGEAEAVDVFLVSFIVLSWPPWRSARPAWRERSSPSGHRAWASSDVPPFSFASLVSAGALLLTLPVLAGTVAPALRRPPLRPHRVRRQPGHRRRDRAGPCSSPRPTCTASRSSASWPSCSRWPPVGASRRGPSSSAPLGLAGAAAIGGALQGMPTLDLDGVTPIQGLGQLVLYGITALLPGPARS